MDDSRAALREFVLLEIRKRDMSARQFADLIGVSHSTINRLLDTEKDHLPGIELMIKLSDATHIDLCSLMLLAYHAEMKSNQLSGKYRIWAQRLEQAPESIVEAVGILLNGMHK